MGFQLIFHDEKTLSDQGFPLCVPPSTGGTGLALACYAGQDKSLPTPPAGHAVAAEEGTPGQEADRLALILCFDSSHRESLNKESHLSELQPPALEREVVTATRVPSAFTKMVGTKPSHSSGTTSVLGKRSQVQVHDQDERVDTGLTSPWLSGPNFKEHSLETSLHFDLLS